MHRYRDFNGHRGSRLPGLERGQHRDVLDRHPAPSWPADPGHVAGPQPRSTRRRRWSPRRWSPGMRLAAGLGSSVPRAAGQRHPVWHYYDAVGLEPLPAAHDRGRDRRPRGLHGPAAPGPGRSCARRRACPRSRSGTPRSTTACRPERGRSPTRPRSPSQRQAANVARTYLLGAANGLAADVLVPLRHARADPGPGGGTLGNTLLSDPDDPTRVTRRRAGLRAGAGLDARTPGRHEARPRPCQQDTHGTYTCTVTGRIGHPADLLEPVPRRPRCGSPPAPGTAQSLSGAVRRSRAARRLTVDYRPVMVTR